MEIIDYNGAGDWSATGVRSRHARYAAEAGVEQRDLSPKEHTDERRRWIYPVMDRVIAGIEAGDPARVRIGIEFIEEDQGFPFGRLLKSKTARALRRASLTEDQKRRVLRRVFSMLDQGFVPREYREYAKLARRIGFGVGEVPTVDQSNKYATKYHAYFVAAASKGLETDWQG